MFEVVEEAQELLVGDVIDKPVSRAEDLRRRLEDEVGVAQRSERHPPDAVREGVGDLCSGLQRQAGLSHSARPGQSEEPSLFT